MKGKIYLVNKHTGKQLMYMAGLAMVILAGTSSAAFSKTKKWIEKIPIRSELKLPDRRISGTVTDSSGVPMPGVTVSIKEKPSIGTTTDLNGNFALDVPENATLVFSMVGFDKQEVPVGNKAELKIQMHPSANTLGETVVVAFGKQKKADVVGAVTTINPSELKVPASNLTTALAGRLAGVIAYQRSGEPGEAGEAVVVAQSLPEDGDGVGDDEARRLHRVLRVKQVVVLGLAGQVDEPLKSGSAGRDVEGERAAGILGQTLEGEPPPAALFG